ncbi:GNAT family N-acetyltransferase [Streptomyces sp. NPDC000877]|uniref:GNAT family N-acetyltransferase n=1 Tax=unclassified Streptomyces TaxID=2593676 RepID=UPI0033254BBE
MTGPAAHAPCLRPATDLRLRPAAESDLAALVRLRDDAARWMLTRGITGQWRPGELDEDHFRQVMAHGEVWLAETGGRVAGAWELWWEDESAWGPQPPVAGYVHRLMVDRSTAAPGTGRLLLSAAERRVSEAGRSRVRLDCLAGNAPLNAYYRDAGYRVVGHKEGKPQPGGVPKSFTLLEKDLGQAGDGRDQAGPGRPITDG